MEGRVSVVERLRGRKALKVRDQRLQRTDYLCEMCLPRPVPATVVDHIKPLSQGGSDEDSNTRNLCDEHHYKVTREQFGQRVKHKIGTDGWPV